MILRAVATHAFVPRGGRFDPRPLLRAPLVALRGGPDGIALGFAWSSGALDITVLARGACEEDDVAWAVEAGRGIAGVDDDPSPFLARVAGHPVLGALARQVCTRLTRTPTLFESFASAVIGQLVTVEEARASVRRLFSIAGEAIPDTRLRAPPTAEAVRSVPMWKMHAIGVGSRRAVTLQQGARRGPALERLRDVPPALAVERLESLPGVGPWTSNLVARRALGWSDAVPVGDLYAPSYVTQALTGEDGDDAAMLAALEPFRPDRARVVALVERVIAHERPLPRIDPHRRRPWAY